MSEEVRFDVDGRVFLAITRTALLAVLMQSKARHRACMWAELVPFNLAGNADAIRLEAHTLKTAADNLQRHVEQAERIISNAEAKSSAPPLTALEAGE